MQFRTYPNRPLGQAGARQTGEPQRLRWARIAACFTAMAALAGAAQPLQHAAPGSSDWAYPMPDGVNRLPDANDQMRARNQQSKQQEFEAANAERRKQIAEDSTKLVKLASDLNAELDKTAKDTLPLKAIRKAEQIEKLAHGVQEKMKLTVGKG